MRVGRQRQVVRRIAAGPGEAEALLGDGNHVGQRCRVAALRIGGEGLQARLGFEDGPGDRRRITAVDDQRIETIEAQVLGHPGGTALLHDLRALLDAPAIEDHHRHRQPAILGPPPAWRPVRTALLLEGTVTEKGHQALARQRHVHVLQAGETKIAALAHRTGRVRPGMAAQRHGRHALGIDGVGVEIADQPGQPGRTAVIAALLGRRQVAGQGVDRLDGCHAVALPHQPATGRRTQGIGQQVADEGRHHVQRTAGVPFGNDLEVLGSQFTAVEVDAPRIGHVRHQAQGHAGQPVGTAQQLQPLRLVGQAAIGDQSRNQVAHALDGLRLTAQRPPSGAPVTPHFNIVHLTSSSVLACIVGAGRRQCTASCQ